MTDISLPEGFAALEPFVARWSVAGSGNRALLRTNSEAAEREAFFNAASPLLDAMLTHLDKQDLNALSSEDTRLMNLTLTLAHIALAVEIQGPDEPKQALWRDKMQITRSPAGV